MSSSYSHQDWKPLIIRGKQAPSQQVRTHNEIERFKRSGGGTATLKKFQAGKNVQRKKNLDTRKLESDEVSLKYVSKELGHKISQARLELKLTRKDLGSKMNEKESVIADWETCKALYNPQLMAKFKRSLKIDFQDEKKK